MKKLSSLMAFIAMALYTNSVWAQTDVTSQYLENADFEASAAISSNVKGYGKDGTPYGLQEVTGWSIQILAGDNSNASYPNSGMAGAVFGYGTPYQMQGNNKSAPTQNPSGGTDGQCLGYMGVWGLGGYYYQEVTLPAGMYSFSVDIFNQSGTQSNESYIGFIPNSGVSYTVATNPKVGEWTSSRISFVIESPTSGRIAVGYKSVGSGSSSNPHIFVDDVKLSYKSLDEVSAADPLDLTSMASNTWVGNIGTITAGGEAGLSERFVWANAIPVGDALTNTTTSLPIGLYNIEVFCASSSTSGRDNTNYVVTDGDEQYVTLIVNGNNVSIPTYNRTEISGDMPYYTFNNVKVTDGTITSVLKVNTLSPNWLLAKIKSIVYLGPDLTIYKEALSEAIAKAGSVDQTLIPSDVATRLNAAIEAGEKVEESLSSIKAATEELNAVIALANNYIAVGYSELAWTGSAVENGKTYYLYNTKAKAFLTGANSWGAQASLGEDGLPFIAEGGNGVYALNGVVSNGGTSHYLGTGGYIDAGAANLTLTEVVPGVYTIGWSGNYYASQEGSTVVATVQTVNNASYWQFLTKEDICTSMAKATAEVPYNATSLIACANFGRNNTQAGSWSGAPSIGGDNANMCAEKFNAGITSVMQTLDGMPNGTYELKAQGFYRQGTKENALAARNNGTEDYDVRFIANDQSKRVKSIIDEAGKLAVGWDYSGYGQAPQSMSDASAFFSTGLYENYVLFTVTDGIITIGVEKFTEASEDWLIFDNFRLMYYGSATINDVMTIKLAEYVNTVESLLAQAEAIEPTYSAYAKEQLDAAVVEANAVLADVSEDGLIAVIAQLEEAVAYAEQSALMGKATPTTPVDATVMIVNPRMDEGLTGWVLTAPDANNKGVSNGKYTNGNAQVDKFLEAWRNGNSLGNASILQTLSHMPSGAYTLTAHVIATSQYSDNPKGAAKEMYLVANDAKTKVATDNSKPEIFSVNVYVTDGELTIGLDGSTTANWIAFDNVTLTYFGEGWLVDPSEYVAGVKNAEYEEHVIDNKLTFYTSYCDWSDELMVYTTPYGGSFYSSELPSAVKTVTFEATTESGGEEVLVVYGSTDGETWKQIAEVAVPCEEGVADFAGTAYNYFKVEIKGSNAVVISEMVILLEPTVELPLVVDVPTFSVAGGNLYEPVNLQLSSEQGATIYWSTDGKEYSAYTGAIKIDATCTIYAYAEIDGVKSKVISATYAMTTEYESIAALLATQATTDGVPVTVTLGDASIVAVGDGQVTIAADSVSIVIVDAHIPNSYMEGVPLTGKISGVYKMVNGVPTLCEVNYAYVEVLSTGNIYGVKPGNTYYIYNTKAKAFLTGANSWGTQASLGEDGLPFIVEENNGLYALNGVVSNGGDSHYFGNGGFIDAAPAYFTLTEVAEGTYTIGWDGNYYASQEGSNIVATVTEVSDACHWLFLTKDNITTRMLAASIDNPYNATALIACANFGRNNTQSGSWSGAPAIGGDNANMCAEKWNAGITAVTQTLTGLPNGTYELKAQGFYRLGSVDAAVNARDKGTEVYDVQVVANGRGTKIKSVMDDAGKLAVGTVYGSYGQAPNTMAEASTFFSAGYYENSVLFTVTDGTATIGVQKFTSVDADWLIFDNFRLVYYGAAPIEEVEALKQAEVQVYVDELAALVEKAKAITNTYTEGAQAQLDAALVVAEDALQVATYDALVPAITAVKKAVARAERAIEINEWIAAEKPSIINPLDVASLIENPNMDINITGWNTVNSDYAASGNGVWKHNTGSKTSADGRVVMNGFQEAWLPSYSSLNNTSSTQTIIDIPNGIYTVSADVIAQAPIRVNGVHFVANDQKVPVATANEEPKHYSIELEVTDHTLTIGMVGEYTTANWLAFDNVTLTYVGMPTDDVVYTMVQDTTDLVAGGKYVLMAQVDGGWVAMSDQSGEIRVPSDTVEVGTVWKSLLTVADSVTTAPALFAGAPVALTLESDSEGWKLYDALTGKYLHWENGDSLLNDAVGSAWTITFNQYGHNAVIAHAEDAARVLQYDAANAAFGAYAGTQTPVYLFMEGETKVAPVDPIVPSFTTIAEVLAFEVNNKIELVLDKAGIVSLDGNNMSITDGVDTLAIYDYNIPAEFNADGVLGGKLVATLSEHEGNKQLTVVDWSGVTFKPSTDWTYMVSTENTAWGGAYCATQFAPAITTVDGREAQMVEKYETTVETTGTLLSQTVTGLDNGMYTVVLYANAFYTSGRGFESTMTDGATDVAYVFANDVQTPIAAAIATETAANGEYTLENVMVTDGTLVLGLGKAKAGTNWHTIQIKSLTYAGDLGKNSTFAGGSITSIKEGNYYVFYTDAEGKNHFLHAAGKDNWVVGNNPVTMAFSAGNVTDETPFANYASFMESNGFYMSNAAQSDGTGAIKTEAVDAGNGPKKRVWESQVFYKNKAGKYAIRMTNSDSESWGANCFVNIDPATLAVAPGNPSLADALYVWEIADEDDSRFSLGVLQALIEKAEAITEAYNKDTKAALDAIVAKAKTATAAQVQTIKAELEAAIAAAETSVADYKAIALELARCNAIFTNVANGEADLKAAITAAETAVADRTATAETLTELQDALAAYEVEGLVNGDFSDGINGWTGDMATGNHNKWTNVNDGFAEKWTASSGALADIDFYQEISGLPAGTYTFTAYVNACQQANDDSYEVAGVSVYANNNAVAVHTFNLDRDDTNRAIGAELVMVTATITDGETLKVGMKVEATDANWVVIDNARLFSFNHNGTGIVNIQNSESVTVYSVDGKSIKTTVDGMKNLEKGIYIVNGKKMYIK